VNEQAHDWLDGEPLEFEALDDAYTRAVCRGADVTGRRAEDERLDGTLTLLAEITVHTPQLQLFAAVLELGDDIARPAADAVRNHSAGVVRLAHRALEVHARDVGYALDAWREQAVIRANGFLFAAGEDDELSPALRGLDMAPLTHSREHSPVRLLSEMR
jgi:hypothetical protein